MKEGIYLNDIPFDIFLEYFNESDKYERIKNELVYTDEERTIPATTKDGKYIYKTQSGVYTTKQFQDNNFYRHQKALRRNLYGLFDSTWMDKANPREIVYVNYHGEDRFAYYDKIIKTTTYKKIQSLPTNVVAYETIDNNLLSQFSTPDTIVTENKYYKIPRYLDILHQLPIYKTYVSSAESRSIENGKCLFSVKEIENKQYYLNEDSNNVILEVYTKNTFSKYLEYKAYVDSDNCIKVTGNIKVGIFNNKKSEMCEVQSLGGEWFVLYPAISLNRNSNTDSLGNYNNRTLEIQFNDDQRTFRFTLNINEYDVSKMYASCRDYQFELVSSDDLGIINNEKIIYYLKIPFSGISETLERILFCRVSKNGAGENIKYKVLGSANIGTLADNVITKEDVLREFLYKNAYIQDRATYIEYESGKYIQKDEVYNILDESFSKTTCPEGFYDLDNFNGLTPKRCVTSKTLRKGFINRNKYFQDDQVSIRGSYIKDKVWENKKREAFRNSMKSIMSNSKEKFDISTEYINGDAYLYNYATGVSTFLKRDEAVSDKETIKSFPLMNIDDINISLILTGDDILSESEEITTAPFYEAQERPLLERLTAAETFPTNRSYDKSVEEYKETNNIIDYNTNIFKPLISINKKLKKDTIRDYIDKCITSAINYIFYGDNINKNFINHAAGNTDNPNDLFLNAIRDRIIRANEENYNESAETPTETLEKTCYTNSIFNLDDVISKILAISEEDDNGTDD